MASTGGQSEGTDPRWRSAPTRRRLLHAAAELIGERGWGRVTTRAVAERAELPHGTVSYHFRGKQELLRAAAMHVFEEAFGALAVASDGVSSFAELLPIITGWTAKLDDPALGRVFLESMREADRDAVLRERFTTMLREYRTGAAELIRTDQHVGRLRAGPSASGLATLLAAAMDGLLLHALLDRDLDVPAALQALGALLADEDQ